LGQKFSLIFFEKKIIFFWKKNLKKIFFSIFFGSSSYHFWILPIFHCFVRTLTFSILQRFSWNYSAYEYYMSSWRLWVSTPKCKNWKRHIFFKIAQRQNRIFFVKWPILWGSLQVNSSSIGILKELLHRRWHFAPLRGNNIIIIIIIIVIYDDFYYKT